jgi:N-sulfoglucosamine sulfohydrolase
MVTAATLTLQDGHDYRGGPEGVRFVGSSVTWFPVWRTCMVRFWMSAVAWCLLATASTSGADTTAPKWNILLVFADDWGRHASCYRGIDGRPGLNDVVHTPAIDRMAREGVLFRNAFVSSPSCTPCRSALLSGRHFFQCGRGAILRNAIWDKSIPSFPLILEQTGYRIGKAYKVWSPGKPPDAPIGGQRRAFEKAGGMPNDFSEHAMRMVAEGRSIVEARAAIVAQIRGNFRTFLAEGSAPWFFFCGPTTTHRPWVKGSGKALWGIDPDSLRGRMPAFLPDVPEVREDVADYLGEAQAVDAYVGGLVAELEAADMLDQTLIVVSGDHGMPGVPAGKCELHDFGTAVALVARVPGGEPGRIVDDFVSIPDLAPTFLAIGGAARPAGMTAQSLMPQLTAREGGSIDPNRKFVITGRERHVDTARDGNLPYPMRAMRTVDHLYIRNFVPDRLPMGRPGIADIGPADQALFEDDQALLETDTHAAFPDMDAGPTKAWLVRHRGTAEWRWLFDYAFAPRPEEELYDLQTDPDQMNNLVSDPAYADVRRELAERLMSVLRDEGDPRLADDVPFEKSPFTDVER